MEITGILQRTSCPALHQRLVLVVLGLSCVIWPVSGPTVENDIFCSRIESTIYYTETRVANRETYNTVYFCCDGGAIMPNGSCQSNSKDHTTTSQSDPSTTPVFVTETTPTSAKNLPDIGPPFRGSDILPTSSTDPPVSAPGEIAKPKGPGPPGRGGNAIQDTASASGEGQYGMIGGVVGVVAALVVMAALMVLFISRRKRRQRDKRAESDPAVVFQLLSASSPERGPSPDIYAEIPDREANASPISGGSSCKDTMDEYSVAFMNSQQSSANSNTYQDVTEPGSRFKGTKGAGGMLPTTTNVDAEVRLTENGAMFAKPRNENMVAKVGSPYQNLPELHEEAPKPDIYDMVGANGGITTVATNPKPDVPVDPEDEAYNMIIIGQNEDGNNYDKLARKQGGSKVSMDDQLDLPIPAATGYSAPGYSALGADTHRGYDKLSRPETRPERKPGTSGSNTYDELAAQHRQNDYDKLTRRGSDDHGRTSSGNAKGLPNGGLPENEYDSVIIGAPADGELYGNLPKKPIQTRLAIKIPPSDSKLHHPTPPPVKSPVARPVYDVIPGSTRMLPSPVYDVLPKSPDVLPKSPDVLPKSPDVLPMSPDHVGVAPVYDIPPAAKTCPSVSSVDEGATDVGGARPVYDTPPVKTNNACPLQFTETSPVYENTPTRRY